MLEDFWEYCKMQMERSKSGRKLPFVLYVSIIWDINSFLPVQHNIPRITDFFSKSRFLDFYY